MTSLDITKDLAISMVASLPIGLFLVDNARVIVYANSKAEDIFGFKPDELLGRPSRSLFLKNIGTRTRQRVHNM